MNKHILFVMRSLDNPELFTQKEKEVNRISASYAAADVDDAAYAYAADAAADAAYATTASAASYSSAAAYAADVEYWVNLFFKRPGKDKQTYINEVERLRG